MKRFIAIIIVILLLAPTGTVADIVGTKTYEIPELNLSIDFKDYMLVLTRETTKCSGYNIFSWRGMIEAYNAYILAVSPKNEYSIIVSLADDATDLPDSIDLDQAFLYARLNAATQELKAGGADVFNSEIKVIGQAKYLIWEYDLYVNHTDFLALRAMLYCTFINGQQVMFKLEVPNPQYYAAEAKLTMEDALNSVFYSKVGGVEVERPTAEPTSEPQSEIIPDKSEPISKDRGYTYILLAAGGGIVALGLIVALVCIIVSYNKNRRRKM